MSDREGAHRGEAWSRDEVEAIVGDYFAMLRKELSGEPYSKTRHRERLSPELNRRSDGSIEFKHANISAVLAGCCDACPAGEPLRTPTIMSG